MEVTKNNFEEALQLIKKLLPNADFVSFDSELSGLGRSIGHKNHDLDTTASRYSKMIQRIREYGLIQIGISIFRFCKISQKYLSATFSFYLSGKTEGSYRYDSSCMSFLARNGFDFNTLFLEGMSFMSLDDEEKERKLHEKKSKEGDSNIIMPVKLHDAHAKEFLKSAIQKVKDAQSAGEKSTTFQGSKLNHLYRKILMNNVAQMFPHCLFRMVPDSGFDLRVTFFDSDDEKNNFVEEAWEEQLYSKLGFTHVVKEILESNKPLVGHNMILDLLHFVHKFVAPLPDFIYDFRTLVSVNMPVIYDTKLLAKDPPFCTEIPNSMLKCLYGALLADFSPPVFESDGDCATYDVQDNGQDHNAGFDAFMTGVCFVIMLKHLESRNWNKKSLIESSNLKKYANRINFMGSYDIPFISISKPDVLPDRRYIYQVTWPSNWNNSHVKKYFQPLKTYKTVWVDDIRLFVIPLEKIDVSCPGRLLESIRSSLPGTAKVTMYETPDFGLNGVESDLKSAPVKRSSEFSPGGSKSTRGEADVTSTVSSTAAGDDEAIRCLKRLKSVGSELFSSMSLESPTIEETATTISTTSAQHMEASPSGKEYFKIADDW